MKNQYTNLYYELERRGISTEEFAVKVFTTARSIKNWYNGKENGGTVPPRQTQNLIAEVLEIPKGEVSGLFEFGEKK